MINSVNHDWPGYTENGKKRRNKKRREERNGRKHRYFTSYSQEITDRLHQSSTGLWQSQMGHVVTMSAVGSGSITWIGRLCNIFEITTHKILIFMFPLLGFRDQSHVPWSLWGRLTTNDEYIITTTVIRPNHQLKQLDFRYRK